MPFLVQIIDLSLHLDTTRNCHVAALFSEIHITRDRRFMATKETIPQQSRVGLN